MNYYDDEYNWERRPVRGRNPMASAAMVLGILAIVLCSAFYIAFPCGALAVICAILSRDNHPMTGKSKAGMVCGIVGMVISAVLTVSAFRYVLTTEEGHSYLEYYYRMYTGDYDFDVDEALEGLFPFLSDSNENGESGSESSGSSNGQDSREDSGAEDDHSGMIGDDGLDDGENADDGSGHDSGPGSSGGPGSGGNNGNDGSDAVGEGGFI